MLRYILVLVLPVLLFSSTIRADTFRCSSIFQEVPIKSALASASTVANLWGSSDSLAALSRSMIEEAAKTLPKAAKPESIICPQQCKQPDKPEIVLLTKPNRTLENYSDREVCQELLTKTNEKPLNFEDRQFNDVEALTGYYTSFAQGKGEDGAELYRECHSSCSPVYSSKIKVRKDALTMSTAVICGHARDKSEGRYVLTSSYRWSCRDS